jgi:hypothetical protein
VLAARSQCPRSETAGLFDYSYPLERGYLGDTPSTTVALSLVPSGLDGIPAASVLDRLSLLKYRNARGSHMLLCDDLPLITRPICFERQ